MGGIRCRFLRRRILRPYLEDLFVVSVAVENLKRKRLIKHLKITWLPNKIRIKWYNRKNFMQIDVCIPAQMSTFSFSL